MHEYSSTTNSRTKIYYMVALVAAALSSLVGFSLEYFVKVSNMMVVPPSGMLVFLGTFVLFDKYVWKWSLLYRTGLIQVPDVSGIWEGALVSGLDEKSYNVKLTITQTYTKIRLRLDTATSSSMSHMATLEKVDDSRFTLRWEYFAEPTSPIGNDKFRHYGVTMSTVDGNRSNFKSRMKASYYTEMDRDTSGTISLTYKGQK